MVRELADYWLCEFEFEFEYRFLQTASFSENVLSEQALRVQYISLSRTYSYLSEEHPAVKVAPTGSVGGCEGVRHAAGSKAARITGHLLWVRHAWERAVWEWAAWERAAWERAVWERAACIQGSSPRPNKGPCARCPSSQTAWEHGAFILSQWPRTRSNAYTEGSLQRTVAVSVPRWPAQLGNESGQGSIGELSIAQLHFDETLRVMPEACCDVSERWFSERRECADSSASVLTEVLHVCTERDVP